MIIKIKKLSDDARVPEYATDGSAAFDLYAASRNGEVYGTGLSFEIPDGYAMLIFSRSGDGFNRNISLVNSVGVIDSDYRGEVKVRFRYGSNVSLPSHEVGDRIAQGIVIPIPKVSFKVSDYLTETERGTGGFGSTGK